MLQIGYKFNLIYQINIFFCQKGHCTLHFQKVVKLFYGSGFKGFRNTIYYLVYYYNYVVYRNPGGFSGLCSSHCTFLCCLFTI